MFMISAYMKQISPNFNSMYLLPVAINRLGQMCKFMLKSKMAVAAILDLQNVNNFRINKTITKTQLFLNPRGRQLLGRIRSMSFGFSDLLRTSIYRKPSAEESVFNSSYHYVFCNYIYQALRRDRRWDNRTSRISNKDRKYEFRKLSSLS